MQSTNMQAGGATSGVLNSRAYVAPLDYESLAQNPRFLMNSDRKVTGLQDLVNGASNLYVTDERLADASRQKSSDFGKSINRSSISDYRFGKQATSEERVNIIWDLVKEESDDLIGRLQNGVENRGQALQILRKLRGISTTEAASLAGKSTGSYRSYERDAHLTDDVYESVLTALVGAEFQIKKKYHPTLDYSNLPNAQGLFKNQKLEFSERVRRAHVLYGTFSAISDLTNKTISASSLSDYSRDDVGISELNPSKVELIDRLIAEKTNELVEQLQKGNVAHVGEEIKILRKLTGLTTQQVADGIGTNLGIYKSLEKHGRITQINYNTIVEYLTQLKVSDTVLPVSETIQPVTTKPVSEASQTKYSNPQDNYDKLNDLVTELTTGSRDNTLYVADQLIREVISIAFGSMGDEELSAIIDSFTKGVPGSRETIPEGAQPKPEQEDASLIPIANYGRNPEEVAEKVALLFYEIIDSLDVLKSQNKGAERDILGAQISKADVGYFTTLIRAMLDGRDRYQSFVLNTGRLTKEGRSPKGLELMIKKSR